MTARILRLELGNTVRWSATSQRKEVRFVGQRGITVVPGGADTSKVLDSGSAGQ